MRATLVATKLHAPTYAGDLVLRRSLIERLSIARSARFVLIHAPAGYGKTTLALQWRDILLNEGAPVGWLSLDDDDNYVARFLAYLIKCLGSIASVPVEDLNSALEVHTDEANKFVLSSLINSAAASECDLYIMIDDWHLIRDQTVHEALAFLLSYAPSNLHLLVMSRTRPPLPLTRLRVAGQAVEIGADELRFNIDESRQFMEDINHLMLPDEILDQLWRSTDGWVAALQLASLSLRDSHDPGAIVRAFSGQHRSIGDYLAENVLDKLPADILRFLLRTSILERLCAPLCTAVSGDAASQQLLERLERQNLFLRPLDEERRWFRYHHLFAAYLRRRLERDEPQVVRDLHLTACEWFASKGRIGEAVGHALQADAEDRAVDLVEQNAMWLVEHSRMASLIGLVNRLPARRLVDHPALQMAIGWANCLIHRPQEAHQALDRLDSALAQKHHPNEAALRAEARLLKAAAAIYDDHIDGVEALVKPLIEHPEAHRPWVVAVAANVFSYVLIHSLQFERARALQAWALPYHERTLGPFAGIYGRCFAGLAAAAQGELRVAADHYRDALALARENAGSQSHAARLAGALWGQMNYECNNLEHAERLLEQARALGAEGGVVEFSLGTYIPLARLRSETGELAAAHALLDEGAETARQLGIERLAAAVEGERLRLYLIDGDVHTAERLLKDCRQPPAQATAIKVSVWESRLLAHARLARARGETAMAMEHLRTLLERASADGRRLAEIRLHVSLAVALADFGAADEAQQHLVTALEWGAPQGMVRTFLDEGATPLLKSLREALRRDQLPSPLSEAAIHHLSQLIAAGRTRSTAPGPAAYRHFAPSAPRSSAAAHVDLLREREQQILHLLAKGCSNKEIARNLDISVNTVKWYLKAIYSTLCVTRRTQAAAEARRLGIID